MRLKSFILFVLLLFMSPANAQYVIYWSGSSANGNWDWGSGCSSATDGNWDWNTSGSRDRSRPDCNDAFNIIKFENLANPAMNLNSSSNFNANQILFIDGTIDRIINTDASRSICFQNNNGNCKIENNTVGTTHTFNVTIFVNSGGNYMEINPVSGQLLFNNPVKNNSDNPINISGGQQVTFSGDIAGTPGVTINNTATVVYKGTSKTYSGTTTINTGTKLIISTNQTLEALALNGGTLQIDPNITLTLTGTYSSTGGTIDNRGTIKFAGDSVTFPGNASVNNGTANTLSGLEAASSGTVTLNSLLRVTKSITVSSGALVLANNDLRLNNASLNINAGATFDNGEENQIINEAGGIITISGTFITRDQDGFVGTNTAIPSITPTLNAGSIIEYGLNGDQVVQGSRSYFNLTFSNSGTKTLSSAITNSNTITGTVTIKDTAILDVENKSFGGSETNLTMTGTSEFKTAGTDVKPDAGGIYSLGIGTKISFTNSNTTTLESIRLVPVYYNIDIIGNSVGTNTATGSIDFQLGGTLTVKNSGIFKLSNTTGFSGGSQTAISTINNPAIILDFGSTIEYAGADQNITAFSPSYSNLAISGSGIKTTTATRINVNNDLNVKTAPLTIKDAQTFVVNNKVNNSGGTFVIENNGSLVQVNDGVVNSGNIMYQRKSNSVRNTDYTYWSTPVSSAQTLSSIFPETLDGMYYSYEVNSLSEDWKRETATSTMALGKGYIVRGPETNPPPSSSPTSSFIGTPNNGIHTISGIFQNKYYLLGNPYPSALNANKFLEVNEGVLDGTLYFWTHNTEIQLATDIPISLAGSGSYAYTSADYASYNGVGGVAASGGTIPSGKIAAAQGFFASSNATITGTNEIVFNNSMRVDNTNNIMDNSQFFKNRNAKENLSKKIEKHRIWLNLKNSKGAFKQALIGYITDATNEYDSRFDGESFDANKFVDFYSLNQGKKLVIQGRALPFNENDFIPLGFRTTIEGIFTINIEQIDGVLTNQTVFIEDKLMNVTFDLKTGNYPFNTVVGTFNDRFILRYTNKNLETTDFDAMENQVLISNKNKQIKVNSAVEPIDKVVVYDLLGRQIFKKEKVNSNEFSILNLVSSQQTLLVKVTLQNGYSVTKKIVY